MESTNQDILPQRSKGLPSGLNTLTILTFIGCALSYGTSIWSLIRDNDFEDAMSKMEKMRDQSTEGSFAYKMAEGSIDMAQKSHEYKYILFASALLFTTLCLVGAIQMRKLKKNGFMIYVVGEIAPLIIMGILIGFSFFGGIGILVGAFIAILFVILYANQRKYLVN